MSAEYDSDSTQSVCASPPTQLSHSIPVQAGPAVVVRRVKSKQEQHKPAAAAAAAAAAARKQGWIDTERPPDVAGASRVSAPERRNYTSWSKVRRGPAELVNSEGHKIKAEWITYSVRWATTGPTGVVCRAEDDAGCKHLFWLDPNIAGLRLLPDAMLSAEEQRKKNALMELIRRSDEGETVADTMAPIMFLQLRRGRPTECLLAAGY